MLAGLFILFVIVLLRKFLSAQDTCCFTLLSYSKKIFKIDLIGLQNILEEKNKRRVKNKERSLLDLIFLTNAWFNPAEFIKSV